MLLNTVQRLQITIAGQVQGVGFRPHVYRLAKSLSLTGWVKNTSFGVVIEVQGIQFNNFIEHLQAKLPALAKIDFIESNFIPALLDEDKFQIHKSELGNQKTKTSPDIAICNGCLQELFDPKNRYYHYPFLNCTQCGPRLTITYNLPYDRGQTSMNTFPMCPACLQEYSNPENRRYHAQATACAACGPQLSQSMKEIVQKIVDGNILAIKGLGGYQLICDARNETAIANLRQRKQRPAKPFALMALNVASIQELAVVNSHEASLLNNASRPIVLLRKKNNSLPENIAPGLSHWGIMLPYTPLHYLLFHGLVGYPQDTSWLEELSSTVLIVTSANASDAPLVTNDSAAQIELNHIADGIISYNRNIVVRVDDSVMRVSNQTPVFIRRARGYAPTPIKLPHAVPSILATGGHLKNTFCMTRDHEAFISQHIGDLENAASIAFFHETLDYWLNYLNVKPECVAHDTHPDFYTTRFAQQLDLPIIAVQHHHAHLAAVAAEHHIQSPALGLVLDGYGYGENGEAWGGELFLYEGHCNQRLSSLLPLAQPGGDNAARHPWRMAVSVLHQLGSFDEIDKQFGKQANVKQIKELLIKNINSPLTSSCGRLFDAASALLNICQVNTYEGQAAMQLESLVTQPEIFKDGWQINSQFLSLLPLMRKLLAYSPQQGANLFHGTLTAALADWVNRYAKKLALKTLLIAGGCFLNKVLLERFIMLCEEKDIRVFYSKLMPSNDGGISLGQAWVAINQIRSGACV